jgi:hypothetical protein
VIINAANGSQKVKPWPQGGSINSLARFKAGTASALRRRHADRVKQYLVSMGVPEGKIELRRLPKAKIIRSMPQQSRCCTSKIQINLLNR